MEQLSLGICGTSRKENEHRLPVHPLHLDRIDAGLRARIFLERGYGERFGIADAQLAPLVAGVRARQQLITECDVIVLPKPTGHDIAELREGQVLWGWPHYFVPGVTPRLARACAMREFASAMSIAPIISPSSNAGSPVTACHAVMRPAVRSIAA